MRNGNGVARTAAVVLACVSLLAVAAGCGYCKNVRDDFADMFVLGVGVTPPVVPRGEGSVVAGIFPPSLGVYAQATDFIHLGALVKASGDLVWDRRGCGVVADRRMKFGLGPFHYVRVDESPIWTNAYKRTGNELDAWRGHMRKMKDPLFKSSAKELTFDGSQGRQPYLYRGWQDWEMVSVEVAVPDPFLLHSGFNLRAGVSPCQVFDFVLSLFGLDLYNDAAYECWSGDPKYGAPAEAAAQGPPPAPGPVDKFFEK